MWRTKFDWANQFWQKNKAIVKNIYKINGY